MIFNLKKQKFIYQRLSYQHLSLILDKNYKITL